MKQFYLLSFILLFNLNAYSQGRGTHYVGDIYNGCNFLTDKNIRFTWSGSCSEGYCNGYGTIQTYNTNGSKSWKYIGNLRYGKAHGKGKMYRSNGSLMYDGDWENDYVQGYGTQYYSNGDYYVGYFEKDKQSGKGTYYWNDGGYYTGNWSNGRRNGYGKEVLSNGKTSEGYFSNGKYIGSTNSTSYTHISPDNYGYETLSSQKVSYWKYYVPANTMGVFTLKNKSKSSDFDIYIYSNESRTYLLKSGVNSGTTTELITVPVENYGRYVYIKIHNDGYSSSKYNLYPHFVDFGKKGEEALIEASAQYLIEESLKWLFGIEENSDNYNEQDRNVGRASTLILSTLKGDSLGEMAKSSVVNEITTKLRDEFGYGFWGDLLVNYAIGIVDETYKNYW